MYKLRKTTTADIPQVMEIIEQGSAYLKSDGVDQWQNGYPNEAVIKEDIENGYGYVLESEGKVVGTVALSFDGEPFYDEIYNGRWQTEGEDFLVIHRMAVSDDARGTGAASEMLHQAEQLCIQHEVYSIRIDTHEDNYAMQRLIQKNDFQYSGIVILGDEGMRLAFEKML